VAEDTFAVKVTADIAEAGTAFDALQTIIEGAARKATASLTALRAIRAGNRNQGQALAAAHASELASLAAERKAIAAARRPGRIDDAEALAQLRENGRRQESAVAAFRARAAALARPAGGMQ
jgi:hypothetical protein